MNLYVVTDVHGFYSLLRKALEEAGFFEDQGEKKVVVCGDLMDRGRETLQMQEFMMDLLAKDMLIFIRGNHEDLMECMLCDVEENLWDFALGTSYHIHNGTWDTALALAQMTQDDAISYSSKFVAKVRSSSFMRRLIPASVNYYETEHYIFVHGWIPAKTGGMAPWAYRASHYEYFPEWREACDEAWRIARWQNGMELAKVHGVLEPGKTIVCGHYHVSWAHSKEGRGTEYGKDAVFTPYSSEGILALDACTAHSGMINCVVIKD